MKSIVVVLILLCAYIKSSDVSKQLIYNSSFTEAKDFLIHANQYADWDKIYEKLNAEQKEKFAMLTMAIYDDISAWFKGSNLYITSLYKVYEKMYTADPIYERYWNEMLYISRIVRLPPQHLFALQIMYEVNAECTAVVARNREKKLILAHNLDFVHAEQLRSLYMTLTYKVGETEYLCASIFGLIGGLMCMKRGNLSVLLNERCYPSKKRYALEGFSKGSPLMTWAIRYAVETKNTFWQADRYFKSTATVSRAYLIFGDKITAAIAEKDRGGVGYFDEERRFDFSTKFLAQCNRDYSDNTQEFDKTNRTYYANKYMSDVVDNSTLTTTEQLIFDKVLVKPYLLRNEADEFNDGSGTISVVFMTDTDGFKNLIYWPGKPGRRQPDLTEVDGQ